MFLRLFLVCLNMPLGAVPITPKQALERLMSGNQRYIEDNLEHPNRLSEARECAAEGQMPFAIILGCSDSRVSPEIIFDQGIGDLFVVRVAGNVLGPIELASIEYSALYLKSSIILVLGHENCGAVKAVLAGQTKNIESIAELIKPVIKKNEPLKNIITANVEHVIEGLKKRPTLTRLIKKGALDVVGGYYDLTEGKVLILP